MPKKKKKSAADPVEGDEENGEVNEVENGKHEDIEQLIEQLLENRYTTRESALRGIISALSFNFAHDLVEKWRTTLVDGLQRSLKKGRDMEQQLAAQVVRLVVLTLGTESEQLYDEFHPILQTAIKDNSEDGVSSNTRNQAITALAMLNFISNADDSTTKANIDLFEEIWENRNKLDLHTSALKAWTLLLTELPPSTLASRVFPRTIKPLVTLLNATDVDTRMAAGESIAYLFDVLRQEQEEKQEDFDIHAYDNLLDVGELLQQLKELSFSTNKHSSKKDRSKQKGFFKEIVSSVEAGEVPGQDLVIAGQKVSFDTWPKIIRLNFIRDSLAQGLLEHLENNPLLSEIFGYEVHLEMKKERLSKIEKRMLMSPNSDVARSRSKERNVDRAVWNRSGAIFNNAS